MKKEFWEQYTIGDDNILTDNVTGERVGFFIDPITNEVSFIPEEQYAEEMKKKNEGFIQSLRKFFKPIYG